MISEAVKPLFYEFADFRLDAEKHLLWRGGEQISLTPKVFETLLIFLEHRGEVLEKERLMNLLWSDSFVEESNLAQNVAVLRKALGEKSKEHKFIVTIPGRGYRFVAEVREIFEKAPSPVSSPAKTEAVAAAEPVEKITTDVILPKKIDDVKPSSENLESKNKWLFVLVPFVLLAIAAAAYWFYASRRDTNEAFTINRTAQLTSWTGLDCFPAIAPDGNTIAFSSDRTGSFEIYVKQLVPGAREVQITADGGQNFEPAFAPDGSQIAYYSKKRGGIWIVPLTGGNPKQLSEFGSRPAFSPDGSTIVFQTDPLTDIGTDSRNAMPPSTIWSIPVKGGEAKQITQIGNPSGGHGSPSFSPDGKRIVFTTSDTVSSVVWTISVAGDDLKKIAELASDAVYMPDGKSILAFSGRTLLKINISEWDEPLGEPVKMFVMSGQRPRQLSVSLKNKRIVYSGLSIDSNIWSTPLTNGANDGGSDPNAYTQNANSRSIQPAFSSDGKKIVFQSLDSTGILTQIWMMDADGKNQTQLTIGGGFLPRWFPGDDRIAYLSRRDEQLEYWSVTLDGGKEKKLFEFPQDATQARISPDGKTVAFNSKQGETLNVWTIPSEGGAAKQLTFDKELAGFPVWSPDGKSLAIQIKRGENTHVAVISADGGEPVQLTADAGQSWIHDWSADGDKIIFAGQRGDLWNIYSVSRATKEQKQLTDFKKINSYVRYPAISPQNDQIVYEYAETTGNIWLIELK